MPLRPPVSAERVEAFFFSALILAEPRLSRERSPNSGDLPSFPDSLDLYSQELRRSGAFRTNAPPDLGSPISLILSIDEASFNDPSPRMFMCWAMSSLREVMVEDLPASVLGSRSSALSRGVPGGLIKEEIVHFCLRKPIMSDEPYFLMLTNANQFRIQTQNHAKSF